jgi:hypothetical protein
VPGLALVTGFVGGQIEAINEDPALRAYGAALALVTPLTVVYWALQFPLSQVLDVRTPAVCWPFFESCAATRFLEPGTIIALLFVLFVLGVANAAAFASRSLTSAAYWLLVALSISRLLIVIQDYRLILNQHYMALWTTGAFLFWPAKRQTLPLLIVSFYVWAGTLKVNPEWLTGMGLYGHRPLGLPTALIPAGCAYVVVLELGVSFGLLAKRARVFWVSLLQFLLFHVASFWVVGFFYPTLMFLLLSILPLVRRNGLAAPQARWIRPLSDSVPWSTYVLISVFSILQLVPYAYPGDTSVTGEGRMFALHMFDARVECRAFAVARLDHDSTRRRPLAARLLTARIACDPIVYFSLAKHDCKELQRRGSADDFDLVFESRRVGAPVFQRVVLVESFCRTNPTYQVWRHNWWIAAVD